MMKTLALAAFCIAGLQACSPVLGAEKECRTVDFVTDELIRQGVLNDGPVQIVMPNTPFNLSTFVWLGSYTSIVLSFDNDNGCKVAGYVMPGSQIGQTLIDKYMLGDI
ncbi:MAG: hypothetical protein ACEQSB_00080 [Undibacterium sp.]